MADLTESEPDKARSPATKTTVTPGTRSKPSIASAIVLLIAVPLGFAVLLAAEGYDPIYVVGAAVVGSVLVSVASVAALFEQETSRIDQARERTRKSLAEATPTPTYFDQLVEVNVETLAVYYELVRGQAGRAFAVTLFVSLGGFILLIVGIGIGFQSNRQDIAFLSAASGLVTEFISAIFFAFHARNVRQLKDYHDSLLVVQNVLLAFRIVETTSDPALRAEMAREMVGYLVRAPGTSSEAPAKRPR